MKTEKYIGYFKNSDGHEYELDVNCSGELCAFFLLTAKAIESGRHYQLDYIENERGGLLKIDDISKCNELFN